MLSRVRQFGDLRQSRSSKKDNLNSSFASRAALMTPKSEAGNASVASFKSHYVCINCVNKQLSCDKRDRDNHRAMLQRSRYEDLQRSRRQYQIDLTQSREKKQAEDKRKITDYNQSLIDSHEKEKLKEQKSKEIAFKKQEMQAIQSQRQLEEDQAKKKLARQLFRNELQNQINEKNQKRLREEMKQRYPEPLPQDENWGESAKKQRQKYREQLQNQINENKLRKQQEIQKQFMNSAEQQTYFNELIDSNTKKYLENERSNKKRMQDDSRTFQQQQQQKRRQKQHKLEQERMQALINQEFQEKQQFENQIMKNDRINRYKREIEQQIKENEQKRNKLRNADKTGLNSTMGFHDSEIERKLCDSCEKTYPKKYMTRVKN